MDISETTAPRSDQQNYDDYIAGPRTVTIADVTKGGSEQPVEIHLEEFPGRPYKPNKTMRRMLMAAWGKDTAVYAGRRMTLYGDPDVMFGGVRTGGIKISHLSHLAEPVERAVTVKRGKKEPHVIEPLLDVAPALPEPTADEVAACTDQNELRDMWSRSGTVLRDLIEQRVAELKATDPT